MSVAFVDLKRDSFAHQAEYLAATKRVLESGFFSLGPEVEAFEKEYATYHGVEHAIGVNGGTWALWASFLALELNKGTKVLMPANTFIATAEAAVLAGLQPVFCDVDERGMMSIEQAEEALKQYPDIALAVLVHLYGQALDMDQWLAFAERHRIELVEDVAQAHGSCWKGKRVGSFGRLACFSFYPTKPLGALGEGGMVLTNDPKLNKRVRGIRLHGIIGETKYQHDIFGANLKMEALQATFLRLKLPRLDQANVRRREIAQRYVQAFQGLPLHLPEWEGDQHVFHLFVIRTEHRDELQTFLKLREIGTGIHYPLSLPLQPSMQAYATQTSCPVAQRIAREILSLPLFPEMTEEEIQEVIQGVRLFFENK